MIVRAILSLVPIKIHIYILWRTFLKLRMHVACDKLVQFYILLNFGVTMSKVKVTRVIATAGTLYYNIKTSSDLVHIILCIDTFPPTLQKGNN